LVRPRGPASGSGRVGIGVAPDGRSELVRLFLAIRGATLLSRREICVDCISFYCRWQLLSALSALMPGPEVAGDMAAVAVVSMAAVVEAFVAAMAVEAFVVATAVEAFVVATAAEAFVVATAVEAFVAVTEVIEAATVAGDMDGVTVAGDMDAVTATEAAGGMGLASG